MPPKKPRNAHAALRIGEAAELIGVAVDPIRRWAEDGTLRTTRSSGGQRLVSAAEVRRLMGTRRRAAPDRTIVAQSARNRFPGVVTKIVADRVAATVEVQAGPHRLLSLLTAEAVRELQLKPGDQVICVATTTSTQDSGLLDVLIPDFEKKTGYKVKTSAVGTGAALAIGARGDADVVLVHAASLEQDFMKQGNGERRLFVMHNDFVLVGPPADPAKVKGKPVLDALKTLAAPQAPFISRGDNSGTDVLERSLCKQAGISPAKPRYAGAATGMGQTLQIASEKNAYPLTDRATYLARKA